MEIYLIRHTRVRLEEPTCYGWTDLDVADTFPQEAAATRQALSGITFDKVYCSPLRRAAKLAAFCGYPDAERDDRLREMWMGNMEMVPFSRVPEESIDEWYHHYMDIRMPGGESTVDLYNRMKSFFDELRQKPYRRVAVFYHGCAILCTKIYAGVVPPTAGFDEVPDFGSVTKIVL
jgi:alpha-ribazole phosphatase